MTDVELLECLIISSISGNITEEETNTLQQALAESEEARNLRDKIIAILTSPEALKVINAPPGKPPFSATRWERFLRYLRKI